MSQARTMGDVLRSARRKRRVSIERAAEETRIRADFLMRMESDEFDFLAPAYVRGFLRNYSRFLAINPEPMLEEFDRRYGTGRADTGQIAALERRGRNVPKERRKIGGWTVAASLAACVLVLLAWIGYNQTPEGTRPGIGNLGGSNAGRDDETAETTPTPEPSRKPKRERKQTLALSNGIEVEIVAARAECWVSVQSDGVDVYTSSPSLQVGQRAGPFSANESMDIVLGNPYGVDLIVNGRRLGPVGESGIPLTVSLPEDAKSLL